MAKAGNNVATRLGGGLVEISAVATLVGGPISEAMTLGLKSAAGLPWASVTTFGMFHVAKVSLAAAVPDWLREPLGLVNESVDAALGTLQEAISSHRARTRIELGDAKGILLRSQSETVPTSDWTPVSEARRTNKAQAKGIYRTDRSMNLVMGTIADSESGQPIMVHEFKQDYGQQPRQNKEMAILAAACCKLAEPAALRKLGANQLWFLTCIPWLYGLASAIVLMTLRLSHDRMSRTSNYDVLLGRLPQPLYAGGPGTIACGLPRNVRRSKVWRLVWIGYFPASMVGLVGTFVVLAKNEAEVVYTWIGFQALWLFVRTLIFYLSDNAAGSYQSLTVARGWEHTPTELKQRTMQLLLALAGLQTSQHPRGVTFYRQDVSSIPGLISLFSSANWKLTKYIKLTESDLQGQIYIQDVANDNLLRCINWVHGATLSNNEIYDSCLAFVRARHRIVAVPAVRVSSCGCTHGPSKNLPRGDSHVCNRLMSFFWIPAVKHQDSEAFEVADDTISLGNNASVDVSGWLHAFGISTKGTTTYSYMTSKELDEKLMQVEWQISLTKSSEFEQIVDVSRKVSASLIKMIRDLINLEKGDTIVLAQNNKESV